MRLHSSDGGFGTGLLNVGYTKTVGLAQENANREVFKQSTAYNDSAAKDIARYKLQYDQATSADSKKAIVNYIVQTYANFDESKLENAELRMFLRQCLNGGLLK
jgi:predicted solute-binding protein